MKSIDEIRKGANSSYIYRIALDKRAENMMGFFNVNRTLELTWLTKNTLSAASLIFIIYALHLPIRTLPYTLIVGIFRSGGDTVNGAKFDLISLWGISIPPAPALSIPVTQVQAKPQRCWVLLM